MLNKSIFSSLALTSLLIAGEEDPSSCGKSPYPIRQAVRHIEANGVGYSQGYTTIESFFSPFKLLKDAWLPFVDLRAHIFNDARIAANGGLGLRYLGASRIWGSNAYYDYRETSHYHYQQLSLGFESLGQVWDFRINGYLPIGVKESPFFAECPEFTGHSLLVSQKREFAMKGGNAEVGVHIEKVKNVPLYFAAGPYYLEGQGKVAWGGELRAVVDLFDYVRLEGNTSYDNIFKWIGQGQLSLNVAFGKTRQVRKRKEKSCRVARTLSERALQRVDRNEIIPLDTENLKTAVINPETCLPYYFWFVDNRSCGSAGTFEEPFGTLIAAQNVSYSGDVIYVFPGDGTSKGMDQGIVLRDSQKLLGAGVAHTFSSALGCVTVPGVCGYPLIDDINRERPYHGCVRLGNACEVAGMHIMSTKDGIGILGGDNLFLLDSLGITQANVHDNLITDITGLLNTRSYAILFANCNGELIVKNNVVSNARGFGVVFENRNTNRTISQSVVIEGNVISEVVSNEVVLQSFIPGSQLDLCVKSNKIRSSAGIGSAISINYSTPSGNEIIFSIKNNEIIGVRNIGVGIFSGGNASGEIECNRIHSTREVVALINFGETFSVKASNNIATNASGAGDFTIQNLSSGTLCLGLNDNSSASGFFLSNSLTGTFNLESSNGSLSGVQMVNVGSISTIGTINIVPVGACSFNEDNQECCDLGLSSGLDINMDSSFPLRDMTIFTPARIDFTNKIFNSTQGR